MTHEQLAVLHAIVTEGTFRGAAAHLHKSQSAVSHMLKKLEQELGFDVLSREDYRPSLTVAGEVFYREAIKVLQQMQALNTMAKQLTEHQEAEVHVAVTATYPISALLAAVHRTRQAYPATHIRLSSETMGGSAERLLRDEADMVIATIDCIQASQVEAIALATTTIVPVAHPDFEAALKPHMKTMADMQNFTQIIVSGSSSDSYAQSRDILPGALRWTVSDFATKKEILLANMGWGGMPRHLIEQELVCGKLLELHLESYPPRH